YVLCATELHKLSNGFPASSQRQTSWPHPGQPDPYLVLTAAARSTFTTFAIVVSQASTSANSAACSSGVPSRSAAASSPTSSINHMNVPSTPRARSFSKSICRISDWKSSNEIDREVSATVRAQVCRYGCRVACCASRLWSILTVPRQPGHRPPRAMIGLSSTQKCLQLIQLTPIL